MKNRDKKAFIQDANKIHESYQTFETIAIKIDNLISYKWASLDLCISYESRHHYTKHDTIVINDSDGANVLTLDCSDKKIKHTL